MILIHVFRMIRQYKSISKYNREHNIKLKKERKQLIAKFKKKVQKNC